MSIINISSDFYNVRTKSPQRQKQENKSTLIAFADDGPDRITCGKVEKSEFHTGYENFQEVLSYKQTQKNQSVKHEVLEDKGFNNQGQPLDDYLAKMLVEKNSFKYE